MSEMLSGLGVAHKMRGTQTKTPVHPQYEKQRSEEHEHLVANPPADLPADLFYMKQIIHNACGTIALVHSIANNKE